jgi:serine protease Do
VYDSSADGDGFCDNISLYLYGGEYFDNCKITAEIVGASKNYDLAVLKVSGSDVVKNSDALAAEWVDGEEAYIGESVYAVGNPEGEKMSVTVGIISKDSEDISVDLEESSTSSSSTSYRVLRTDAAINGGNSGGGLFNTQGKLVGIINAKTVSEEVDNMGYALPAATSKRVVQNILDAYEGTETHGINKALIGITTTIQSSYSYFNSQTNLTELVDDVVVYSVDSTSKFASGLQVDDVIQNVTVTSADGTVKENMTVNRQHNISDAMLSVRAGDTVTLLVKRGDETFTVSATYAAGDLTSYS